MNDEQLLTVIKQAVETGATHLDLSYQELSVLPPEIGVLDQLVRLDLRHNQLVSLVPEIGLLTNLQMLDLRDNRLLSLPPEMEMLANLKELDLRENQLQVFPQVLLRLINLEELHLWSNPLVALPLEMEYLSRLRVLNLGGNAMTEIPPAVWRLSSLERLIVDHTHVRALPPEVRYLQRLTYLELHDNRLSTLPREIGVLKRLLTLVLHTNAITHLPFEIGDLSRLRHLDLRRNQLVSLPPTIGRLRALVWLDLADNPLAIPPEILARREEPEAILTYYVGHLEGAKRPLNEAKMVLVGQAGVGKTSLTRRLITDTYDPWESKTEGIAIQPWRVQVNQTEIKLNVWDFGGQEIMHATHQFFLTRRTLYLLVLDCRLSEEENRLEYWLKIIQSFGGDSPVIVVGNKADLERLDLDRRGLMLKYPQIRAILETSCATGLGIDRLRARIAREVTRMPHVRDSLLNSWFAVKEEMERLDHDYVPYERYLEVCRAHGVLDERSQRTLIGFLHDLGVVLNFQDDPRLEDTNILNPEWVTNGVYRILNDARLVERHGVLERSDLDDILDPHTYPRHKHQFILDMMQKFELCFPFEGTETASYLIPDLLSKEAPPLELDSWDDVLRFEYHYNVLPSSIISRFIVRMHRFIHDNLFWRSGVVVADQGNLALVRADREDRKIQIWVKGPERTRRMLLSLIRFHFDVIHGSISGIEVQEKVPLPDHPEILVDYQYLLDLEAMGERSFVPPGLRKRIEVRSLLEGLDLAWEQRQAVRLRQTLVERFDEEELRTLCYDLGIDFESLPAEGRAGKARELVAYLERRQRLGDLARVGEVLRPDIPWRALLQELI